MNPASHSQRARVAARKIADYPHLMDLLAMAIGKNGGPFGLHPSPTEDFHSGVAYIAECIDKCFPGYDDIVASLEEIVNEWGSPNTPKWHRARAAIAKARGESQ